MLPNVQFHSLDGRKFVDNAVSSVANVCKKMIEALRVSFVTNVVSICVHMMLARNSIREHRWTEVQTSSGMGKIGPRNHCISDQAVASQS